MLASLYTHVALHEPGRERRRVPRADVADVTGAERRCAEARAAERVRRTAATAARPEVIARDRHRLEAKALAHGHRQARAQALEAQRA